MLIRYPEDIGTRFERINYPAGEVQMRLTPATIEELFRAPTVEVLCRKAQSCFMELALLADALHHLCPFKHSTLILPYLPYSRADRRFQEGDCAGLKVFGEHLGALRFNAIRTLDAHSHRAAKLVPNLVNVSARDFVAKAFRDICEHGGHPALLLPDEGSKGRYDLDGVVQCSKKRDASSGQLSGFEVPEFERTEALIVDDICDGGGTFIGLAHAINDKPHRPTKKLYLYVTHGIFSKGTQMLLSHFEKIFTTNSFAPRWLGEGPRIEVYDCEKALLD